ncbi:MAG: LUD domain-containing protein [Actinomycetota bacterium]|nr:LUD domain-containing protein [Actinomycetota bacterium]
MKPFAERYDDALADHNVHDGLLAFQRAWRTSRDTQIAELSEDRGRSFAELAHGLAETKAAARRDRERLLAELTEHVEARGTVVHHAATAADAVRVVADLCREHGVRLVVKSKSMLTEEIFLNDGLAAEGVEAIETDLGEWLLQLAGEHPSHLVVPAIHKRRGQIAELLGRVLGREFDPDDIEAMVRTVRTELREAFLTSGAGITGANALIAGTGSVMLVTNEGNAGLTTTLPPVHIAMAGFDKLVPDMAAAMDQVRLLAKSATGQRITTYTTFITGPRPGQAQHLVLVDNGRSDMADDPAFDPALGCIRCGACADVCPPYQIVGGHVFGHVYTGAIGLVNTSFHHSLDDIAGPQNLCVSCGACSTACPAEIPLAAQILEVRSRVFEAKAGRVERWALKAFSSRRLVGAAAAVGGVLSYPLRRSDGTLRLPLPARHRWRSAPIPPVVAGRRRPAVTDAVDGDPVFATDVSGTRVALFLQCLSDRAAPPIVEATARLVRAAGAEVVVPSSQHCCGLPAFDRGDRATARSMAADLLDALDGYPVVVTPGTSCLAALGHEYDDLFADDPARTRQLADLRERLTDIAGFLTGPGRYPVGALAATDGAAVAVHRFCQATNVLGRDDTVEALLAELCGIETVELAEQSQCCGFGGSASIVAPEVSAGIVARKLGCVDDSGAQVLVTDNPGCVLHLRAAVAASDRPVEVLHLAELLARRLDGTGRSRSTQA